MSHKRDAHTCRRTALLRGGRITRHKGQVASCAPMVGSALSGVSAIALGAMLTIGGSAAQAGSCTNTTGTNFTCSGPAAVDPARDATIAITPSSGPVTVTTQAGFGQNASGTGIRIDASDITFTDSNASSIQGGGTGMFVNGASTSAGGVSITSNGTISSVVGRGLLAQDSGTGNLTINVANTRSNNDTGLEARKNGVSGNLSITSSGTNFGGDYGILAIQSSEGSLTVSAVDATGLSGHGIYAANSNASSTDINIRTTGTVTGGADGIRSANFGTGSQTIVVNNVTGNGGQGINATNSGTDMTITTNGNVHGNISAISAANNGSGTLRITAHGNVTANTGSAISAASNTGGLVIIDLRDGANVSSAAGSAIFNDNNNSQVTFRAGSTISGNVRLNGGVDTLTIEGGADISAATALDGGAGSSDALTFSGFTGTFNTMLFQGWETLTASNGGNVTLNSADATGLQSILVDSGATITAQNADFTFANSFQVGSNGRFMAGAGGSGAVSLTQDVLNNGLISTTDGGVGDQLTFGGNLSGSGTIGLDVNLTNGTNDRVQVNGDSAGANQGLDVTTSGSTVNTAQTFTLVAVSGASTENDFRLVNADFVTNDGAQAISDGEIAYRLQYDPAAGRFVLTPFRNAGTSGPVTENPGGDFLAAQVQQVSDQLSFNRALQRVLGATQRNTSDANTVSRALSELTSTERPLVWVQAEGQRSSYTVGGRDVDTNSGGLRFGAMMPLAELANGALIGGLEFGVSGLSTDVTNALTGADISTDAYDATLSALWVANSQLYVDGQLRYGYFDSTTRPNGGAAVDTDSSGYGLSIEVGKPYALGNGLTLVPQLQVMYSDIDTDDVVNLAGGGQTGSLVDGDTLTARLGLRAEHVFAGNAVLFGQVDYYHGFDAETSVAFGQNTVLTERGKNTAALTLGGSVPLSARTTLFGEINGETGIGGNSSDHAFGGNIGLEFRF